ncbi:DUF3489 domain-containing protein [Muricoccus radiodurans]|uniref:DUF3489 domain-containing protein n=1 Tax=Muricoccus radiodurans TaxID=2231721 RepID=UPI003CE801DF
MTTLSDTQSLLLSQASQHPHGLMKAPDHLPAAARNAVVRSLLKAGMLEEIAAPTEHHDLGWRQNEDGTLMALRITEVGLRALGIEPDGGEASPTAQEGTGLKAPTPAAATQNAPAVAVGRPSLRDAAGAVLTAWDAGDDRPDLPAALEALRAALTHLTTTRQPRDPAAPRRPREGTKQQAVLALLRRPEGATIADVITVTGWAQHTVRGFLAGLKKKGISNTVLERVRQVGPGKEGVKGSYSIYRVVNPAPVEAG